MLEEPQLWRVVFRQWFSRPATLDRRCSVEYLFLQDTPVLWRRLWVSCWALVFSCPLRWCAISCKPYLHLYFSYSVQPNQNHCAHVHVRGAIDWILVHWSCVRFWPLDCRNHQALPSTQTGLTLVLFIHRCHEVSLQLVRMPFINSW